MEEKDIKKQKQKEAEFFALSVIFSLMLVLAAFYFVFKPMVESISEKQLSLKNLEAEAKYLEEKKAIIEKLEAKFAEMKQERVLANAALPDNFGEDQLMVQLMTMGNVSGVIIKSFQKQTTPQIAINQEEEMGEEAINQTSVSQSYLQASLKSFNFSLQVEGKYSNIKKFLKNIEDNIRPIKINSVNINKGAPGSDTVFVAIEAVTFYLQ